MKFNRKYPLIASALLLAVISCNRDPVPPPQPVIDYVTVKQLRKMYDEGVTTIDTNIYIQGIITITPELGNLPSFVAYLQDSTAGICLTVSGTNTFSRDSEVKILCRGVSFTMYNGLLQFGDISIADQTELISLTPPPLTPVKATIQQLLGGEHQAEYVMIEGVQFDEPGTYSGTNILTDCSDEIDVYTRSDATFSATSLPAGNGYIKGVASVFNDAQLLLRDETENQMTGTRCNASGTIYLSQDFTSLVRNADVSTLAGWKTLSQEGTKTWYGNEVGSRKWVQATAYNSGLASVVTWMIAPVVDMTAATEPYLLFESADGYDNGATLKVYVSTDYTGSATPWTSTWTEKSFTLPPSTQGTYSQFVSSGQIDLTAYKGGQVYVAWVYTGADPTGTASDKTTTWEVDNVLVAEK
ncbi:MAG: DUF5689 domain-containing protein [Bacteroidales bacterium]|nr:DUF5689 domain-containing protein [Bacteroidales bacterium]